MEEPSNPIPSSKAPASSLGVIEKDLRLPRMSENQRRIELTSCSFTYFVTSSALVSDSPLRLPISSMYSSISSRHSSAAYRYSFRSMFTLR